MHDFRRLFTDAVLNGLPPHIAQIIAGHREINVTLGNKVIYPDEAVQAHLSFLARRRALRTTEEYRVPTGRMGRVPRPLRTWEVSTGTCGRAFGTLHPRVRLLIRCRVLWPDPVQRERLAKIRDNLTTHIAEAERQGWLGEIEGLQVSLAGAKTSSLK